MQPIGPPPRPHDQPYWDPAAQTMATERRRELQDERVRHLVDDVFARPVPLFRRKLEDAGVDDPRAIGGVDDLARVPLTVKQDLRDSETAAPPWGEYRFTDPRECVRLGTSTGTTGTPTITVWTRHDLWIEYEAAARTWWRMGHRPGMIATHAHPAYLYAGGVMLQSAYEYFGFLTIWVPPPDTDDLAEQGLRMWTRVTPDIPFMGFSTGRFMEVAAALGIDPHDAGLEFRAPPGFGLGKGMPLMTAGAECFAYLGGGCGQSPGAHLAEDWAVVQAVDPATGREVPDGEWGDLVVTTLDRDNGLLRYDLEEAAAIVREPCPCGETTIRGMWGGRYKDLLHVQGTRIMLAELEGALRAVKEVGVPSLEYQVLRPRDEGAPLHVRVEANEPSDDLGGRVRAAIADATGVASDVDILERGALPRSGYKTVRVVDD